MNALIQVVFIAMLIVLFFTIFLYYLYKKVVVSKEIKLNNKINTKSNKYIPTVEELATSKEMLQRSPSDFKSKLTAIESSYPFIDVWYEVNFKEHEMDVYTLENCKKVRAIFDTLQSELIKLGLSADEKEKLKRFEKATLALNELDETSGGGLIETGEREDLCEIIDRIGMVCGLIPGNYGDGDGIASEWREW